MPFLRTQHDDLEFDSDLLLSEIQHVLTLTPLPWITHQGHENEGNDHQLKELLIVKQIFLVSALRNV